MSAYDRLVAILNSRKILASRLPWHGRDAACFTECPWGSLLGHANEYSPFGVGFTKPHLFADDGGPATYIRADLYKKQKWHADLDVFTTPFWPPYRPDVLRTNGVLKNRNVDYSQEREWRVPHDFEFTYEQVAFVVLDTYEDMARFPKALKDNIGRDKFILMDNYKNVEKLWPVHKM